MKHFLLLSGLTLFLFTCEKEDYAFGELTAPTNLRLETTVVGQTDLLPGGDGSGQVIFVATANDAITYKFVFSDGSEEVAPSGRLTKRFNQVGLNTYEVTVIASGTAGIATTLTDEVSVESTFSDPDVIQFLAGDVSKTWYWAANEGGHLGVGQNDDDATLNYYANYYQATPFEKDGADESLCLYQDELVFSRDGDNLFYQLNNFGQTYFNVGYESVAGGGEGFDFCYDFTTSGSPQRALLAPSSSFVVDNDIAGQTRGTDIVFADGGFMSYYIGATTYEILSLTENRMAVRAVQANNEGLAWYHLFTTTKPVQGSGDDTDYDNLIWSDEFDTDGAPDPTKWGYNTGRGDNGWGNGEAQFYTDRPENVVVDDGKLIITARKETFGGADYTSARLLTENKFEFTYGRVDISAKLPTGGGTWPALWMLGENFATVGWPACGEIDIMEHVGNRQDELFATLHFPGNSGGNGVGGEIDVPGISTEFHKYSAIWSPQTIRFFVDDELYFTFANDSTLPFNEDFFLIFNVAMGGSFGGDIAPGFSSSAMEVDYVRVYQ